jgi:hypothetical protein
MLEQHLLNFILCMKHDNVTMYDAFMRNWFKFTLCDDAFFIASCIKHALVDEMYYFTLKDKVILNM